MIVKLLLRFSFLFIISLTASGQTKKITSKKVYVRQSGFSRELSHYALGFRAGLTQFYGELNEQDMKGLIGFSLSRDIGKKAAVHFDYTAGKIGGQKSNFFNSYFVSEFNTFELLGRWNLSEQFRGRERGDFDFSLYGGVGLMVFNSNAFDLDTDKLVRFTNSELSARNPLFLRWGRPKGPAGISRTNEGILPLGMTLDYFLLDNWKLGVDFRFYLVRTDKVDATSGQRLVNPEESESYSDTPNDKFSFLAVTITHRLGKPQRR